MNYEQRYKEALERARKIERGEPLDVPDGTHIPLAIFPELRESKDEKIRNRLIDLIHEIYIHSSLTREEHKEILSWLRRKEEVSIKWNKNTEGNKPPVNHSILMKTTHGISEGEWKGECWYQYRWSTCVKDSDVLSWIELSDLDKQSKLALEVINEEKVELKYKDGVWIVYDNNVYKIVNIPHGNSYECLGIDNTIRVYNSCIDNKSHLWTIEDAKEGDVLYSPKHDLSWIYKNKDEYHAATSGDFTSIESVIEISSDACPATKEQRDFLFQKLKAYGMSGMRIKRINFEAK